MSRNKHDLLKNFRIFYGNWNAKREYPDENVFFKVDGALSKIISLLI